MTKALKFCANLISAMLALCAAIVWYKATIVKVKEDPDEVDADGLHPLVIGEVDETGTVYDVLKTAAAQTALNRTAASFAAAAAFTQAIALGLPD